LEPLNRFPRMLHDYMVDQVRRAEAVGNERKAQLRTKADALAYQAETRRKLRKVFGKLPKRTPLNAMVVDRCDRKDYFLEKIIFESRPNFPVTANLFIPKLSDFPLPAVLAACGHSNNGKAEPYYQSFCQGLVKKGYLVLIYDPIGQGERLQYVRNAKPIYTPGVREHIRIGNQQSLIGEYFGTWRAWDGIRALDYLLTRTEVDPNHVGMTGNSGGGTMTTLLVAMDNRFTMAAPGCYVTTIRRNVENELPTDSEQIPPGLLAFGMDEDDMLAMHAPKPLILLTQEKDYFDQRGAQECFARLKHVYSLLGAEENVAMMTGPDGHGYGKPLREAMYAFFNRACGKDASGREPRVTVEPDESVQVTSTGQVSERKPKTVFSFTKETSQALAERRSPLRCEDLQRCLRRMLNVPVRRPVPDYRILPTPTDRKYPRKFAASYGVETEAGILIPVLMPADEPYFSRPPRAGKRATLYVSHQSADSELRSEPLVRTLVGQAKPFFALDARGIGDTRPNTCAFRVNADLNRIEYLYGAYGILLSRPLVGQRTHDVLSVLDFLEDSGYLHIHLVGKGWGSVPALFAAVLDSRVKKLTLLNALTSYAELAETEHQEWPLSCLLPGALKKFDLPDCIQALGKRVEIIQPWNAKLKPKQGRRKGRSS